MGTPPPPPPSSSSSPAPPPSSIEGGLPLEAYTFEQVAITKGFISSEQLAEAKRIQAKVREAGLETGIEEIFVKKNWIGPSHLSAIHAIMGPDERNLISGYEIQARLGRGGMATVYRARHIAMDRVCAVKILLPHFANEKDAVERFRQEAVILAQLDHPNIVRGLDAGFHSGIYYFVMEFVDGVALSQKAGRVHWTEAVDYMKQMARALIYAKKVGLVHRDIKPDNILITKDGLAKLTDLGLAKLSVKRPHTSLTQQGWMVGTPAYMAPEQVTAGKDADIRADIYSLGMTFFTLLTGSAAYQGDTTITILQQRITHEIPYKKLGLVGVPESLAAIIRMMTNKDPALRYQDPAQLLEDLRAIESGGPLPYARKLPDPRNKTQQLAAVMRKTGTFSQPAPPVPPPPPAAAPASASPAAATRHGEKMIALLVTGALLALIVIIFLTKR